MMANRMPATPATFCVLPFVHLATTVDGVWGRCCFDATNDYDTYYANATRPVMTLASDSLGCSPQSPYANDNPHATRTLLEAFNSEPLRETRLAMLEGRSVPACRLCLERDRQGIPSPRTDANKGMGTLFPDLAGLIAGTDTQGAVTAGPLSLDLRMGNSCNLRCTMCGYPASSAFGRNAPAWVRANLDPHRDDPTFWAALRELAGQLRRIYFAGGEPFIQSGTRRVLALLIEHGVAANIELHLNSNLTVLDDPLLEQLTRFRAVTLAASCDGVAEVFDQIRVGGTWSVFTHNVARARQFVRVILDATIQVANVKRLEDLIEYADTQGLELRLENFVDYPAHLSVRNLPPEEKTQVTAGLTRLRDRALEQDKYDRARQLNDLMFYLNAPPNE